MKDNRMPVNSFPRMSSVFYSMLLLGFGLFVSATSFTRTTHRPALPANAPGAEFAEESDIKDEPPQQRAGGARGARGGGAVRGVYKSQIVPHWFHNNNRFWYTNALPGAAVEFVLVDAEKGVRQLAFDHQKLAAALSLASDQKYQADRLPFGEIEFIDGDRSIRFTVASQRWVCNLASYECTRLKPEEGAANPLPRNSSTAENRNELVSLEPAGDENPFFESEPEAAMGFDQSELPPQVQQQTGQRQAGAAGQRQGAAARGGQNPNRGQSSPDQKWTAFVRDQNIYLRAGADGSETRLTEDGVEGNAYGRLQWSPDSKALVAWRVEPGDNREVYLVRSSPMGGGRAVLQTRAYAQPGDKFAAYELSVFNMDDRKQIKPVVERVDFGTPAVRWSLDQSHFTYRKVDRGHQRLRLMEVDAKTGVARTIIDEQTKTFIWTAHAESLENKGLSNIMYLSKTAEVIHSSEKDGWRHLYLVDVTEAKVKNQITKGEWVVRGIDKIDEEARQVWFQASGMNSDQDPYFIHHYRINFDGTGLVALTRGNGTHNISFSPDNKYIIDSYSRVDLPPVNELRRASDGELITKLEDADISELVAAGWKAPEVFVAKARDGKTDIWGVIARPADFDPSKKYPILEDIYAGPHDSFAPKTFSAANRWDAYNRLGFVVVKLDGMGTANRSKAFHDVAWHNLKDAGFEDRILWIKAVAAKYPPLDIDRVGLFGNSAGGQNAAGALLFHPDFYKVAVANSGCHDNRLDKASWNEQWMGYTTNLWSAGPDNWYSQSSNIDNAGKLRGKLFLIVPELDTNVPPESTFRFVDALIRAGKDFDFLMVPGADHGAASQVTARRTQDFFVKHLLHQDPPDRNAAN